MLRDCWACDVRRDGIASIERARWISSGVVKRLAEMAGKYGDDYSTSQGMIYTVVSVLRHHGDTQGALRSCLHL